MQTAYSRQASAGKKSDNDYMGTDPLSPATISSPLK